MYSCQRSACNIMMVYLFLPFLLVWSPIISCKFLFVSVATNTLFWNVSHNYGFIWRTFQYLFIILHILGSFLLYIIRQGILPITLFLSEEEVFLSVLSTWSILSRSSPRILFLWIFVSVLHGVFNIRLVRKRWLWSSTLGYMVCFFFKWLWMVLIWMDI